MNNFFSVSVFIDEHWTKSKEKRSRKNILFRNFFIELRLINKTLDYFETFFEFMTLIYWSEITKLSIEAKHFQSLSLFSWISTNFNPVQL